MAEKIGTYCGQMRNLVIFSTQNKLFITFTTLKRTAPAQNRGFIAIYEFAESYIKLDFIQPDAEHIRGTECDQKIQRTWEKDLVAWLGSLTWEKDLGEWLDSLTWEKDLGEGLGSLTW